MRADLDVLETNMIAYCPVECQPNIDLAIAELRAARTVVDAVNQGPAEAFWSVPAAVEVYNLLVEDDSDDERNNP